MSTETTEMRPWWADPWTSGDRFRKARERTGLDQEPFAELIGSSRRSVQPWGLDPVQQQALAGAVEWHVRRGWRVESAPMPGQVVVVHGKKPNHILHLLLTIVTAGLWVIVWVIVAASSKETRAVLTAHPDGTVSNSLTQVGPAPPWYRQSSTWVALGGVAVVLWVVYAFNSGG